MQKQIGLFVLAASMLTASCGQNSKKNAPEKTNNATASTSPANFNAEAQAAPGNVICELNYKEKDGTTEKTGKRITQFFEDSATVVISIYKKANDEVYDFASYTIRKADAKGLKPDLSPLNDGGDNYTTYTPNNFGSVSLVFTTEGSADTKIVTSKSMRIMMGEKSVAENKDNGLNMPVADFKTADEWVKKLKTSFSK